MASILLVAFAARALIPQGFMPSSDRPFSIEICWDGFPADMLAHGRPAQPDPMAADSMPGTADSEAADSMPGMAADSKAANSMHSHPQGAHHHSGSPSHSEHCVFGGACSAGPIPHLPLPSDLASARQLLALAFESIAGTVRLVHLPQPRAPPGRLI